MQEKIFEMLFEKDEITWHSIIHELVRTEQMDPWDIDISLLAKKYLEMLNKLKELDFRISGRVLLAAAILLKMKSVRLVGEDILMFDRLFSEPSGEEESLFEETEVMKHPENYSLIPRTPQQRKRKVSIYDLVQALGKALEVRRRRIWSNIPAINIDVPAKTKEITKIIHEVYERIKAFFTSNIKQKLTFSRLIPSEKKEDKIYTFIPLLHLATQQKIELIQEQHFGEIEILLRAESEATKELANLS